MQGAQAYDAADYLASLGPWVAVTAAVRLLERCNQCLAADAVQVISEGRGKVAHRGRGLVLVLPEC